MAKNEQEMIKKLESKANGEKPISVIEQVQEYLNRPAVRARLVATLPRQTNIARLERTVMLQLKKNPKLLACPLPNIIDCVVQAALDGLELTGNLAALVPYNNRKKLPTGEWITVTECQYQRMYQGIIQLIRRSGEVKDVQAHPIYSKDVFLLERGDTPRLQHIPNWEDPGTLIGFYAYGLLTNGERHVSVMPLTEVQEIAKRSKSSKRDRDGNFEAFGGAWATDFIEMGRKTAAKRVAKYLPMSPEQHEEIERDDENEFDDASRIEVNLGDQPKGITEGGTWPAISAPTQQSVDELTKASGEKMAAKARRGEGVSVEDVASLIPLGPGEGENTPLFDEA